MLNKSILSNSSFHVRSEINSIVVINELVKTTNWWNHDFSMSSHDLVFELFNSPSVSFYFSFSILPELKLNTIVNNVKHKGSNFRSIIKCFRFNHLSTNFWCIEVFNCVKTSSSSWDFEWSNILIFTWWFVVSRGETKSAYWILE